MSPDIENYLVIHLWILLVFFSIQIIFRVVLGRTPDRLDFATGAENESDIKVIRSHEIEEAAAHSQASKWENSETSKV